MYMQTQPTLKWLCISKSMKWFVLCTSGGNVLSILSWLLISYSNYKLIGRFRNSLVFSLQSRKHGLLFTAMSSMAQWLGLDNSKLRANYLVQANTVHLTRWKLSSYMQVLAEVGGECREQSTQCVQVTIATMVSDCKSKDKYNCSSQLVATTFLCTASPWAWSVLWGEQLGLNFKARYVR